VLYGDGAEAVVERETVFAFSVEGAVMVGLEPGVMREISSVDGVGDREENE
jgi:hypothetical protein